MSDRFAARLVGPLGLMFAATGTALAGHALLQALQVGGFMQGNYDSHAHGFVLPIALGAGSAAVAAALCYILHIAGLRRGALPHLARSLGACVGWWTAAATALSAVSIVAVMESAEQIYAGKFDGAASAFGTVPVFGLILVCALAFCANVLLRAACDWLAGAHEHIARAVACILQKQLPNLALVAPGRAYTSSTVREWRTPYYARVNGRRAPPVSSPYL